MREFILIGILILAGSLYLGTAHAQIYQNDQDLTKIVGGAEKNCTNVDIVGTQATTPFLLELVFDPTTTSSITETHNGLAKPVYQKSNQVLVFYTNDTAEYYVTAKLDYPQIAKRDVFERYTSQPNNIFQNDLQYYDSKFCRVYHIITQEPVHIQTREEILGQDIINVPKTLQDLVDTQKYNTRVEIGTFASIEIMILIVLIAIVASLFIYASNMRQNRKLKIQSTESYKTLRKMGEDNSKVASSIKETVETEMKKIDRKLWEFGGWLQQFQATYNVKITESSKIVETKEPEKVAKTVKEKLINFYDKYVKLDDMSLKGILKSLTGKTDAESKAKKEMIERELEKRKSANTNRINEVNNAFELLEKKEKHLEEMDNQELQEVYKKFYLEGKRDEDKKYGLLAYDLLQIRYKSEDKK